jgi:hypothetical protein
MWKGHSSARGMDRDVPLGRIPLKSLHVEVIRMRDWNALEFPAGEMRSSLEVLLWQTCR